MREILDVRRCCRCDTVTTVLVHDKELDDEGEPRELIHWLPRRPHSNDECARYIAIFKEEWPTLW
jgi:hypothetical protein